MLPRPMLLVLTGLITLLWVANVVIGFVDPPRAQTAVNAVFMLVAAMVVRQLRRSRNDDQADDVDDPAEDDTIAATRRKLGELIAGDTGDREPGRAGEDR